MADLSHVIDELNSIINELGDIRHELSSFQGINTGMFVSALDESISSYKNARSRLCSIDTSKADD
ncbi:MAG: hypothetical protein J6U36_03200 [Oscillospiraceae bacterium]|nr:hypothetical protein [Oscillospiraceae bacterium]MBQ5335970.1 hypothetical protein [Oscillospiraceae bacterium]